TPGSGRDTVEVAADARIAWGLRSRALPHEPAGARRAHAAPMANPVKAAINEIWDCVRREVRGGRPNSVIFRPPGSSFAKEDGLESPTARPL
ncbi:MAG: hypothetical protein AAGA56_25970, partial [Myxococcota bacterium]